MSNREEIVSVPRLSDALILECIARDLELHVEALRRYALLRSAGGVEDAAVEARELAGDIREAVRNVE